MQAHTEVAEALDRLRELAAVRRPDDEVLGPFLALYYSELPEEDVDDRKIDDIYSVGVAHFDLGRTRPAGSPVVRVMSPDRERDGWSTPHSVVLMVTDDMPFLVDTMRMVLERHGLDIYLLVHPMLARRSGRGQRDPAGRTVQRPARGRSGRRAAPRGVDPDRDRSCLRRRGSEFGDGARVGGRRRPAGGRRLRWHARPPARIGRRPPGDAVVRRRTVRLPRSCGHDLRRVRQRHADRGHRTRPTRRRRAGERWRSSRSRRRAEARNAPR